MRSGLLKADYEKIMQLQENLPKKCDFIPDVKVEGALIGKPAYHLEKMNSDDPYVFILGKKTSCCQSIDGHSYEAVMHGATTPFGAFYRIMKRGSRDPWVAQGWVGIGYNQTTKELELVIDSIEYNVGHNVRTILDLFELAAVDILNRDSRFVRVVVGAGGHTPTTHEYPKQSKPYSKILGYKDIGYDSSDSRFILAERLSLDPQIAQMTDKLIDHAQLSGNPNMTSDGYVLTHGIDTYVREGKEINGIALNAIDRIIFFQNHPNAERLMTSHPFNPLLEEGFYSKETAEKIGEHFIPFDAIEIFVEKKIKNRVEHLILQNNDFHALIEKLLAVPKLSEGERILFGYISGVHAMSGYIQCYKSQLCCFLVDPEEPADQNSELYKAVSIAFKNIKISYVKEKLQRDHFSCSTFLIQSFMFFAKHGSQIWVNANETPPALLKMAQKVDFDSLDSKTLNAIVSVSKNLTLNEYVKMHTFNFCGKNYNLAAIRKKYRILKTFM